MGPAPAPLAPAPQPPLPPHRAGAETRPASPGAQRLSEPSGRRGQGRLSRGRDKANPPAERSGPPSGRRGQDRPPGGAHESWRGSSVTTPENPRYPGTARAGGGVARAGRHRAAVARLTGVAREHLPVLPPPAGRAREGRVFMIPEFRPVTVPDRLPRS
jgi:hypothetical protein